MRMRIVFSIITLVWIVLLVRIYYISIKSNAYYDELASKNAIKTELLAPLRGSILDTNGKPMAINRLGFSISITPHLRTRTRVSILDEEVNFLSSILPYEADELKKRYLRKDSPYSQDFVSVIDFISHDDLIGHFALISLRENIQILPSSIRHYPYDHIASHVIGYVGRANNEDYKDDPMTKITNYKGRTGIENYYNETLQGVIGERKSKVTAFNKEIEEISKKFPYSSDLELTIDLDLQQYITKEFGDNAGAVIVMEADSGRILAAGSFPEYNLNQFVTGISQENWDELINNLKNPFTNKLVNGLYPPGSIVKMGVGLAMMSTQKVTRQTNHYCNGTFELGGHNFRCWKDEGHGLVDFNKAIRESCDVYFYKASNITGIDPISSTMTRLGFAKKTGVDLPNEFIGTVPGRDWKMQKYSIPWYQGETLISSIGQGYFLATPMQVALHTAILATGKMPHPHFVKSIDGFEFEHKSEDILTPYEKSELPHVQKAMYEVANHQHGTAYYRLINSKVKVAAKTGTAQVVSIAQDVQKRMKEEEMEYFHRSHAWLSSYGPYDNPKYVVTVLVEHGGGGGAAGGPITTKIFNKLLELGYIKQ